MTGFKVSDYATPQLAINALQAAGGGKLYIDKQYSVAVPLIFSGLVPLIVEGDGPSTGLLYTGAPGTNLIKIGQGGGLNGNYGPGNPVIRDLRLANTPGIAGMTGIHYTTQSGPILENVEFDDFSCGTWLVNTWGPHYKSCQWVRHTYCCIGFDPITPANNVLLDRCKAFGNSCTAVVQASAGCNGIYIKNGDFEGNTTLLDLPAITYHDPWNGELGRCSIVEIDGCDLELMAGQAITSENPIYGLKFTNNTTSGTHSTDFGSDHGVHGLIYKNNSIHNLAVTINAANCPDYELGYYDQQFGGSFGIT